MEHIKKYERNLVSQQNNTLDGNQTQHTHDFKNEASSDESDQDIDQLLEDIDNEDIFTRYREQRLQEISERLKEAEKNVTLKSYGQLETIDDESRLIKLSNDTDKIVIHFQLDNFSKCQIMNDKLLEISREYLNVKFVKVNVDKCPFLVTKLNIKILPFVVGYISGIEKLRLVGFSKLGNKADDFEIDALKIQLENSGFI